ncbi:hypothetical protein Hanom_Chr05g00424331 [Helianthus anomalus]
MMKDGGDRGDHPTAAVAARASFRFRSRVRVFRFSRGSWFKLRSGAPSSQVIGVWVWVTGRR